MVSTAVRRTKTVLVTEPKFLIVPVPQSFSSPARGEPQGVSLN
jgi:hypothetical protein